MKEVISFDKACEILSISKATGYNWIKSENLKPIPTSNKKEFFLKDIQIKLEEFKTGRTGRLKNRRNKRHITGFHVSKDYLEAKEPSKVVESIISDLSRCDLFEGYENIVLMEYGKKLLRQNGITDLDPYKPIFECFHQNIDKNADIKQIQSALDYEIHVSEDQDFLGLLNMSLACLRDRKASGSYFTPFGVVKDVIDSLFESGHIREDSNMIDPCCGTGNFLIYSYLAKRSRFKNASSDELLASIHGTDINPINIALTRINMLIVSKTKDVALLAKNFRCEDSLSQKNIPEYDVVVGNPPWGCDFDSRYELFLRSRYVTAKSSAIESFGVFLENALEITNDKGSVCFVLPESFLNVKMHRGIRQLVIEKSKIEHIKFWGNIFSGVFTPAVSIHLIKTNEEFSTKGIRIWELDREYTIGTDRRMVEDSFNFNMNDQEYLVVDAIGSKVKTTYLKGQAKFAIGIVTGDNSVHLHDEKVAGSEGVLRGSDISKYTFRKSDKFLIFKPDRFQQVAPAEIYRADEKLVYKFISNKLIFAYDNNKNISLNSCNLVIPRIEGLEIKYILGVLNSKVAQFYFSKCFNSIKVLRSHIESIPIPVATYGLMDGVVDLVDKILEGGCTEDQKVDLSEKIDDMIFEAYGLDQSEIDIIKYNTAGRQVI